MTRDPRLDPRPGDRWRTEWGVSTVTDTTEDGRVQICGEWMMGSDWRWTTKWGRWVFLGSAAGDAS